MLCIISHLLKKLNKWIKIEQSEHVKEKKKHIFIVPLLYLRIDVIHCILVLYGLLHYYVTADFLQIINRLSKCYIQL